MHPCCGHASKEVLLVRYDGTPTCLLASYGYRHRLRCWLCIDELLRSAQRLRAPARCMGQCMTHGRQEAPVCNSIGDLKKLDVRTALLALVSCSNFTCGQHAGKEGYTPPCIAFEWHARSIFKKPSHSPQWAPREAGTNPTCVRKSAVDEPVRRAWLEAVWHESLRGADNRRERGGQRLVVRDADAVGEVLEPRLHGEGGAAAVAVALRVVVGDHGGARRVGRDGAGEDVSQIDAGGAALVEGE
eukprot:6211812-Pleurochrysis_carterae.AAC.1